MRHYWYKNDFLGGHWMDRESNEDTRTNSAMDKAMNNHFRPNRLLLGLPRSGRCWLEMRGFMQTSALRVNEYFILWCIGYWRTNATCSILELFSKYLWRTTEEIAPTWTASFNPSTRGSALYVGVMSTQWGLREIDFTPRL